MKKFIVEEEFWSLFPDAKIGIVTSMGIDNSIKDTEVYAKILQQAEEEAQKYFQQEEFSRNPVIAV